MRVGRTPTIDIAAGTLFHLRWCMRTMTPIVCPKCDASLHGQQEFEAHMHREHAPRNALGFGHTLFP